MDEHEDKTVSAFIVKEQRPRYRRFLDNPKKRARFLNRLNHNPDLDPRCVRELRSKADIPGALRALGSPEHVYLISAASELDGKTLPLDEAIGQTEKHGWGTVISCVPGRLAYYYGECGERKVLLVERR